jgi:uncharacterized protein
VQLFIDEFSGDKNRSKHLELEMSREELAVLLEDIADFAPADKLTASVDVERVETTFRLHISCSVDMEFECGRCVRRQVLPVYAEGDWVMMLRRDFDSKYGGEEVELLEEDLDVTFYEGEVIDLNPVIREAIILELPTFARCEEGDTECDLAFEAFIGEKGVAQQEEGKIDLRWAALKDLKVSKN